jgi:hypothetical protein
MTFSDVHPEARICQLNCARVIFSFERATRERAIRVVYEINFV